MGAQNPAESFKVPPQIAGIGIAVHKPVFSGAPKIAPWGIMADVVKAALKPYGEDVQVCYNCNSPRWVAEASIPKPIAAPKT